MTNIRVYILLLLLISIGCNKQEEPKVIQWKLQVQSPEENLDYTEILKMVEKIKVMSQGKFEILTFPSGPKAITKGPQIYDGVKNGTTQMAAGWPNWWLEQNTAWAILQGSPYLFMNLTSSMIYFLADKGSDLANNLSTKDGILWRPGWWAGMELGLLSKTKLKGLSDLKGKKIRIGPGLSSDLLAEASKAYPIPVVPNKIKFLLEKNLLDAIEWTTANGSFSMDFHKPSPGFTKTTRHILAPAIWQPSVLSDILINKTAYNALPPHLQQILETAIKEFNLLMTLRGKRKDMEAFNKFKKDGVSINTWPKEDFLIWKRATDKIYSKHLEKSPDFKKVFNSKLEFKKKYDDYMKVFGPYGK